MIRLAGDAGADTSSERAAPAENLPGTHPANLIRPIAVGQAGMSARRGGGALPARAGVSLVDLHRGFETSASAPPKARAEGSETDFRACGGRAARRLARVEAIGAALGTAAQMWRDRHHKRLRDSLLAGCFAWVSSSLAADLPALPTSRRPCIPDTRTIFASICARLLEIARYLFGLFSPLSRPRHQRSETRRTRSRSSACTSTPLTLPPRESGRWRCISESWRSQIFAWLVMLYRVGRL